jgi:putative tryptophan/tyrosine transport system substrate-binding protein
MRNVAVVDVGSAGRKFDLLPIWCFNRCPLKHVERLLTMMNVTREQLARLRFDHRNDNFHVRARHICSFQLLPVLRVQITLSNCQAGGFVTNLSRPGGNITGFTAGEFSMGGKILEVLKQIAPEVSRVAVLLNLEQPPHVAMWRSIEATAPLLGVHATPADSPSADQIERAMKVFAHEPNGGLIVLPSPIIHLHREEIAALAVRHRLPTAYSFRFYAVSGGLVSYGIDPTEQARQAATYVDLILKGEQPGALPIQQPTKFDLVINMKTAKALGLDIPPSLLTRADEVIE